MNEVAFEYRPIPHFTFQIVHGDLTREDVDAIVNAANRRLQHGGGVAAAIVAAGGVIIQEQSDDWVRQHGPVDHDHPAITGGGDLPATSVIHAVGPRWGEANAQAKLQRTVTAALQLAQAAGCHSLSLPAISTGIFGFPLAPAAEAIVAGIAAFVEANPEPALALVRLVVWDANSVPVFVQAAGWLWPTS